MILFVDDMKQPAWYGLNRYNVHLATTYEEAKYYMECNSYDIMYLDHDLGSLSADGSILLRYYLNLGRVRPKKIVCLSLNPIGIERIKAVCEDFSILFELADHKDIPTIKGQSG